MASKRRVFYVHCIFFGILFNLFIPNTVEAQKNGGINGGGESVNDKSKIGNRIPRNEPLKVLNMPNKADNRIKPENPQAQSANLKFEEGQKLPPQEPLVPKKNPSFSNQGGNRAPPPVSPAKFRISDHPSCVHAVAKFCSKVKSNNFAVLDCLQNDPETYDEIGDSCQNVLWDYKKNLTMDDRFQYASQEVCKNTLALPEFAECKDNKYKGHVVACLVGKKMNVTKDKNCQQFLNKMASIIFSDYRLLSPFITKCEKDVKLRNCGRLDVDDKSVHQQGRTVACLEKHYSELEKECQLAVLRVAELQANDYNLDRPLYYACREDRELFCKDTKAGNGKVFKCLYKHKMNEKMSTECMEKLTARQTLIQEDYKISYTFLDTCKQDIRNYGCNKLGSAQPAFKQGRMAAALVCLEKAVERGHQIQPQCRQEIQDWQKSLLEDYQISPHIVSECHTEISKHCKGMQRNGKTLHCLMALARPSKNKFAEGTLISSNCKAELMELIDEADPDSDFSIDPAIAEACGDVARRICKEEQGTGEGLACLMDNLDNKEMNDECVEVLLDVQYFMAREFRLDKKLYRQCRKDAIALGCLHEDDFDEQKPTAERGPLVLSCLHNKAKDKKLSSRQCLAEVRRVMRERTASIDLEPEIEDACMKDLAMYCSGDEHQEKGAEMECLEENLEKLTEVCRTKVGEFITDEDEDPVLDRKLMSACMPMLEKFCKNKLEGAEPEDIMECLIDHKNDPAMDNKCACGIEHHQLITSKDFTFSYKFKKACKDPATKHCKSKKQLTNKAEVVYCLSELVFNDTIMDRPHRIPINCRRQLKYELLTEGEAVNLDAKLMENCDMDIQKFCGDMVNEGAENGEVEHCLKKNQRKLSDKCHVHIFKKERLEVNVVGGDYTLMHTCKTMIKLHCSHEDASGMIPCLKQFMHSDGFDPKCRKVVDEKLILQHSDFRLNPALHKACRLDVPKFCRKEITDHVSKGQKTSTKELEGVVIACLKKQFVRKESRLSPECHRQVSVVMQEAQLDYRRDPVLAAKCDKEIKEFCSESMERVKEDGEDEGGVEECLKQNIQKIQPQSICLPEVIRLFVEGRADVHVDPHLYDACSVDLKNYCADIPKGLGRQMSCLLSALDDNTIRLTNACNRELTKRRELWAFAAKVAPAGTFDIFDMILASPSRNSFLGLVFAVIAVVLIIGLFCGRVTKRVSAATKNK